MASADSSQASTQRPHDRTTGQPTIGEPSIKRYSNANAPCGYEWAICGGGTLLSPPRLLSKVES
jgi:hypothetical protein